MAKPSLPQFENEYDQYKMRSFIDEIARWSGDVEAEFNRLEGLITATSGGAITVHNDLTGRSASDTHPIASITGLTTQLAAIETDIDNLEAEFPVDHGSLTGLGDDDHPQYTAFAQDEVITGQWTFEDDVHLDNGVSLRIHDSTDTDYADFSHDGTDFLTVVSGTTDWRISGFTAGGGITLLGTLTIESTAPLFGFLQTGAAANEGVWSTYAVGGQWFFGPATDAGSVTEMIRISRTGATPTTMELLDFSTLELINGVDLHVRDGSVIRAYDSSDADYLQIYDSGAVSFIESNTNPIQINPGGAYAAIIAGKQFRHYDSTNTDYMQSVHDGTDYTTSFVNTTDWNIDDVTNIRIRGVTNVIMQDGATLRLFDATDASSLDLEVTSTTVARFQNNSGITDFQWSGFTTIDVLGGTVLRIRDAANTDSVSISHDGTNLDLAFANTTYMNVRDGVGLRIFDASDADSVVFNHDGTDFFLSDVAGTDAFHITGMGSVRVRDGAELRVYDAGDTDFGAFSHNGTDFLLALTNTEDIVFSGHAGDIRLVMQDAGDALIIENGGWLQIFDTTDTDSLIAGHDGTDFDFVLTNTTDVTIVGQSRDLNIGDAVAPNVLTTGPWSGQADAAVRLQNNVNDDNVEFALSVQEGVNNRRARFFLSDEQGIFGLQGSATTGVPDFRLFIGNTAVMGANVSQVEIRGGTALRILDSGNTDYLEISHNGTDVTLTGVNTTGMNIGGMTDVTFTSSVTDIIAASTTTFQLDRGEIKSGSDLSAASFNIRAERFNFFVLSVIENVSGLEYSIMRSAGRSIEWYADDVLRMELAAATSRFSLFDGYAFRIYDSTDTDYVQFVHGGVDFTISFVNTTRVFYSGAASIDMIGGMDIRIRDAGQLVIYDSTDSDFAIFEHNGTDFITSFTNTSDWQLQGLTQLELRSGADLRIYGPGDSVSVVLSHTDSNFQLVSSGSSNIQFSSGGGFVNVISGNVLRVWDSTNTDRMEMDHDGTDFNFDAINTTDVNFTGATNYNFDDSITILEKAAANADVATIGQVWVRNDAPNTLWFTDDAGGDHDIIGQTKFKAADETVTSSTTFQDDDDFVGFNLDDDSWYKVEGFLIVSAAVAAGSKYDWVFSNAPQDSFWSADGTESAGLNSDGIASAMDSSINLTHSAAGLYGLQVKGFIQSNAATGGTVKLQWAQNASNVFPTTIHAGSWVRITKIG